MNKWLTWIIIVVVVFGGVTLFRFLVFKKKKKDYIDETNKINREIDAKIKRDTAAGMKKAEEIRANAIANARKEDK